MWFDLIWFDLIWDLSLFWFDLIWRKSCRSLIWFSRRKSWAWFDLIWFENPMIWFDLIWNAVIWFEPHQTTTTKSCVDGQTKPQVGLFTLQLCLKHTRSFLNNNRECDIIFVTPSMLSCLLTTFNERWEAAMPLDARVLWCWHPAEGRFRGVWVVERGTRGTDDRRRVIATPKGSVNSGVRSRVANTRAQHSTSEPTTQGL